MHLDFAPKRHRYPRFIISEAVWRYHRFNDSFRDIQEHFAYRGIEVSHETIRSWCYKFSSHFKTVIKKRERKPSDKWHLDEMMIKIQGKLFILWRAVNSEGHELDTFYRSAETRKRLYASFLVFLEIIPHHA